MAKPAATLLTVDEFLATAEEREGRWEIEDGVVYAIEGDGSTVAMAPERIVHAETKTSAWAALSAAIRHAKAPCRAVIDGPAVRIASRTAYQPDVLVYCGPRLPPDSMEVPRPVIVVEVLSPSTQARDRGGKRVGYFSLPSVQTYLLLDPQRRSVLQYRRGPLGLIEAPPLSEGRIRLDPPGLELEVTDLFPSD